MSQEMKKSLPSLSSNYADLIESNAFYVDKTQFIHKLEKLNFKYLFFLRPRRFGKSLFLSVLEHYYGVQYKERFNGLFSQYFIGKPENRTATKNSYHILRFDFSGIDTQNMEMIKGSFNNRISTGVNEFISNYGGFDSGLVAQYERELNPADYLASFLSSVSTELRDCKIYILIDEYDHFTNELFAFNTAHFQEVVSRNGWVRKFYEVIKQFTGSGLIDRFFATGVTPVTLDNMTSGFNIGFNITQDASYHAMAGFTEEELKELIIRTIYDEGAFDLEKLLTDMRTWFNGSRFSAETREKLYNPQLVISFLTQFSRQYTYPKIISDNNVTSDWKKIGNILAKLPQNVSDSIIEEVYINERIKSGLSTQFNLEIPYTKTDAISVLFYNGLLTIDEERYGITHFVIPNYVIKSIYWEYFRVVYELRHKVTFDLSEKAEIFEEMARDGKIDLLVKETAKIMELLTSKDYQNFRESNIKMIVISILSLNRMYIIHSEMEVMDGRVDLLLTTYDPYNSKYQFLIEFKYVKLDDEVEFEKKKADGIAQIQKYKLSANIKHLDNLKSYLIIFHQKRKAEILEC